VHGLPVREFVKPPIVEAVMGCGTPSASSAPASRSAVAPFGQPDDCRGLRASARAASRFGRHAALPIAGEFGPHGQLSAAF